ncbi:YihY/virulence factor BrkB family protein [Roseococcus pinisoli]|uniref:YihY/virulence factor BrkB family protein n=1 Tax=Roseococcus pinisoli TaxID=2835040 RepID=A0ABS5QH79_9PROT|nr:YihY/virulence factor BrkB family protein [Roseococcus pinisoli]MBS7812912.1 YihY/virulence factor BrkB family protein [Roseococcus pinisoli]
MLARGYAFVLNVVEGFLADEALTRAAAIAYFALFSLGPLLFLISGLAGLVFGEDQVRQALADQMRGLIGQDAAGAVQRMSDDALGETRGGFALALGIVTLMLTASGAFGALQSALNAIWKTEVPPAADEGPAAAITAFMRAKALSIGLVGTTGFLLLVSLVISAGLNAFGHWLDARMPGLGVVLSLLSFAVSLILITLLFAAVYKILPDRRLQWRDVLVGAFATALLFSFGKMAISFYIGTSGAARGFGAAGALAVVLLWLYYSAVIFLLGAEFTRAWSGKAPASAPKAPPVAVETLPPELLPPATLPDAAVSGRQDRVQAAWIVATIALLTALGRRGRRERTTMEAGRT